MARDLNRLFEDLQNSREVFVTQDGQVERADEAVQNASQEQAQEGAPRPRTQLKPEIFGKEPPLQVWDGFFREAHATAAQFDGETGAIGVGPDPFSITEFIAAGPGAKRTSSTFQLDPEYLQPLLNRAEARGLYFNMVWHSHPEGCPSPSEVDRAAARSMLNDSDWGLDGHVFLPISVRKGGGFETRFFVADGREARIREVTPVVVSSGAMHATAAALLPSLRVVDDREALRARGWDASLRETGSRQSWRVERSDVVLWLVLPPEYPASPPDVYLEDGKRLRRIPSRETPVVVAWSSLRSIAAVAEQAHKAVVDNREAEALILRPRLIHVARRMLNGSFAAWRA